MPAQSQNLKKQGGICIIRPAKPGDLETLNQLAYESEAYWGHSEEIMRRFASLYQLTETTLEKNIVRVLTFSNGEGIVAFFSIKPENKTAHVDHFYVRRDLIGCGLGRKLWKHLVALCRQKNFNSLEGVTFPKALPFYLKMGAVQIKPVKSCLSPAQLIPKFKFDLTSQC